ncbi:hypothetical protein PHET_05255 [Paragonimus heterotremus]|uniref:U1-type domain-containing protein n=1 Tax=Paragonimus heterotremus TaxID=100268 RepID=A0A8J4TKX4_9TREM|nr:hypothetical protein PHET_05255 [Paragonimus heterotremus]
MGDGSPVNDGVSSQLRATAISQWIRNKIEDEGVQARNIIKYSLPVGNSDRTTTARQFQKKPTHSEAVWSGQLDVECDKTILETPSTHSDECFQATSPRYGRSTRSSVASLLSYRDREGTLLTTTSSTNSSCTSTTHPTNRRTLPLKSGRCAIGTKVRTEFNRACLVESEYRARYWGQMLDTLRRTIDEIYSACETDESEVECKEVIMILEHSKQDFFSLIEKMNLLREYEEADEQNKPNALAWDERTTLPGKPIMCQVLASAAVNASSADGSYLTIPVNLNPELGVSEVGDNDSDRMSTSWHLIVPKNNRTKRTFPLHLSSTTGGALSDTVTPTNNSIPLHCMGSANGRTCVLSTLSGSEMTNSGFSSVKDDDAAFDETGDEQEEEDGDEDPVEHSHDPEMDLEALDAEDEDEELSIRNLSDCENTKLHEAAVHTHVETESFLHEGVSEDGEDNTLSRDLQQIDEAIASVTTAERLLTDRLGRAQCAEAALRRRLLAEDKAVSTMKQSRPANRWHRRSEIQTCTVHENVEKDTQQDLHAEKLDVVNGDRLIPSLPHHMKWNGAMLCQTCVCQCHIPFAAQKAATINLPSSRSFTQVSEPVGEHQRHVLPVGKPSKTDACLVSARSDKSSDSIVLPVQRTDRQTHSVVVPDHEVNGGSIANLPNRDSPTVLTKAPLLLSPPPATRPPNGRVDSIPPCSLSTSGSQVPPALLSTVVGTTAVATAKGLLFLSEASAKSRVPGHGIQMHEKLSARSQKRTANSIQELEQKQARARILRQQHLFERSERVHELSKKSLEAEQKQHSILTKHEESRVRLDELAAERRRRLEEKLGREEAVKGRRRALEASRRARLDALQAQWKTRAQQLASRAELLEHTRRAAAKAKEQHREIKMANLEEQQRTHIEELRSRIQRKQEESKRRHQESLREISRKAFEMSVLTHTRDESFIAAGVEPYSVQKWCRACQVMIVSEVALKSHLHGTKHQKAALEACESRPLQPSDLEAFNLSHLVDAPADFMDPTGQIENERLRVRRKRARKLRQRMNQRALQFMKELEQLKPVLPCSPNQSQIQKLVKDARRFLNLPDSGPWVITRIQAMEKTLNALLRCLTGSRSFYQDKIVHAIDTCSFTDRNSLFCSGSADQLICVSLGLLSVLANLIGLIRTQRPSGTQLLPDKTYQLASEVLIAVCHSCPEACYRMVCSNDISILIDCLIARFSAPLATARTSVVNTVGSKEDGNDLDLIAHVTSNSRCTLMILDCLTCLVTQLADTCTSGIKPGSSAHPVDSQRIQDLLGYLVSSGLVDLLAARLSSPRQVNCLLRVASPGGRNGAGENNGCITDQGQHLVLSSISLMTGLVTLLSFIPGTSSVKLRTTSTVHSNSQLSDVSGSHTGPTGLGSAESHPVSGNSTDKTMSHLSRFGGKQNSMHLCTTNSSFVGRCNSASSRDTPLSSSICSSQNLSDGFGVSAEEATGVHDSPTKLLETVLSTEVFGLIPLLYSLLLSPSTRMVLPASPDNPKEQRRQAAADLSISSVRSLVKKGKQLPSDMSKSPTDNHLPFHSSAVGHIVLQSLRLFNSLGMVNRRALQSLLSSELTCLLTRHILLTLIARCAPQTNVICNVPSSSASSSGCCTSQLGAFVSSLADADSHQRHAMNSIPAYAARGVRHMGDDDDEVSSLLPSGARQVVVRSVQTSTKSLRCEKSADFAHINTLGLPDWANEVTPSEVPALADPVKKTDEPIACEHQQHSCVSMKLTEAVLHEAILCVGHLCVLNLDNQTSLQSGPPPTLLQRLVALPFDYFSQRPLTDLLYPTLIAFCYRNSDNLAVLEAELNPSLLANYIEERILERTMEAFPDNDDKTAHSNDKFVTDARFRFECRFPVKEWASGKDYFTR